VRSKALIHNLKLKTQNLLSRHPEPNFQGTWNFAQILAFLLPLLPLVGGLGLFFVSVAAWKQQCRTIIRRPLNWGLAILSIGLIISCCFAVDRPAAFLGLANFLPFFFVFAGLSALIEHPHQLRQLAKLLAIASVPIVLLGFGQIFWGWVGPEGVLQGILGWSLRPQGNPPGRMASLFMYANILAVYLQIILILGLGLWVEAWQAWRQRGMKRPGWLLFLSGLVIGNAIALILTSSRNAWAIALLSGLAFALYQGWRLLVAGAAGFAASILWASFGPSVGRQWLRSFLPAYFWLRLSDQLYPDRPVAQLRTTQWRFAWSMAQERPGLGWGLRNFTPLYEAKMQLWLGHPHNLFLMLMAEIGIPATLLFCGLVGWILAASVLLLNQWSDIPTLEAQVGKDDKLIFFSYLLAFASCTLFNFLDVTLFDVRVNLLTWVLLAAIYGVVAQYREQLTRKNNQ
jgi:O-antigen ligase